MLNRLNDKEVKELFSLRYKKAQIQDVSSRALDPIGTAIQNVLPSICSVWIKDKGETWNGSGFLITPKHIVTASPVVEGITPNAEIFVAFQEDKYINAVLLKANPEIDSAVLSLENSIEDITPLQLCPKEEIMIGEEIAVIGSPAGWQDIATVGRISAINKNLRLSEDPSFQDIILIDADIEAGSSGSAVINIDGKVVGIVMAMIGTHAEQGVGQKAVSPAYKVNELIQDILNS